MTSPAGPAALGQTGAVVYTDQLGQLQYAMGELRADIKVILTRLEQVPDHEDRLRVVERNQVSGTQVDQWKAQMALHQSQAQTAQANARKAMWTTIGLAVVTLSSIIGLLLHH